MSVYITNLTQNVKVGVQGKTLHPGKNGKPGDGAEFPDEVADIPGIIANEKKGMISVEMVKSAPVEAVTPVKANKPEDKPAQESSPKNPVKLPGKGSEGSVTGNKGSQPAPKQSDKKNKGK